ncbi:MAG TPA: hypothetical protein VM009_04705, partial [Terriglobales bacterium]|nr:hypothetical protein [Terriglobales bacterium]
KIARPADLALAQEVADAAVTLVIDKSSALPSLLAEKQKKRGTSAPRAAYDQTEAVQGEGVVALILVDDLRSDLGRVFERELRQRIPDVKTIYVDNRIASFLMENVTGAVLDAKAVIVAAYAAPSAGRGTAGLRSGTGALLDRVLRVAGSKTAMVAMGNPYVAVNFPLVQTYLCTFSNAVTSEQAAAKALFGEIALKGKLPVTLPKIAERGAGIERAAVARKRPAPGKKSAEQLALSRP